MTIPILTILLEVGTLVWLILQFLMQRKNMAQLVEKTSDLEYQVQLLMLDKDYSVERLKRTRDLITGLVGVTHSLRQKSRPHYDKLQLATQYHATFPELRSLINVIGDDRLRKTYNALAESALNPIFVKMWNETDVNANTYDMGEADAVLEMISTHSTSLLMIVHELWEEATRKSVIT